MTDQEIKELRKKVTENYVVSSSDTIPRHRVRWAFTTEPSLKKALANYIDLFIQLNTLRLSFLVNDLTPEQYIDKAKEVSKKMDTLEPVINAE